MPKARQPLRDENDRIGHELSIGDRLRILREMRGVSQQALADRIGAKKAQIGQWERQERNPGVGPLRTIADALDGSFVWIVLGQGDAQAADAPNTALVAACVEVALAMVGTEAVPAATADIYRRACARGMAMRHASREEFVQALQDIVDPGSADHD